MPKNHSHDQGQHRHETDSMSDTRLIWAIAVNVILTVVQVVGGLFANSLALVADALHNLNDAASLVLALVARRIGRKPPDELRTFGYRKAPVVGALINLTTLIIVGLYLVYEAVFRFFERPDVGGWIVVVVAGVALVVDVVTGMLTYAMSKESLNIKAAFVHNVSDALASVGVVMAGTLIILYDWYVADIIVTLAISGYILYQGITMIGGAIAILLDSAPKGFSLQRMVESMEAIDGIRDIHHVHVWRLDESRIALEAHITINDLSMLEVERLKSSLKALLRKDYCIEHATLEFEVDEADEHDRRLLVE